MTFFPRAAFVAALLIPLSAHATDLGQTVATWEDRLDGRVGIAIQDTGTGYRWGHREDERFLMNSTVKVPLCAAILSRTEDGALALDEPLPVREEDVLDHAPVTSGNTGSTMTIEDLCLATIDQSDNTAANLLFARLGGPKHLTAFLRDIGDRTTRSDRIEPELNTFIPDDPRDTTTPAAMVETLETLLTGDALGPEVQGRLIEWMQPGGVTGAFLRASAPEGWQVADKSGGGDATRNLIAMLTPPSGAPIFVSLWISDTQADFPTRNAALSDLSSAVIETLVAQ